MIFEILDFFHNAYANTNMDTGVEYSAEPFFIWNGDLADANAQYNAATDYTGGGFGIYFNTNDPELTLEKICAPVGNATHSALVITPPSDVTGNSVTYNTGNPMTNSGVTGYVASGSRYDCSSGTLYAAGQLNSDQGLNFNVGGGGFDTKMPDGVWTIEVNGDEAAAFDLAAANPMDSDNIPLVYVPSVKISKNGSDVIEKVEIVWYRYDKTAKEFKEVENLATFSAGVESVGVELTDYSGTTGNSGSRIDGSSEATAASGSNIYTASSWDQQFKIGTSASTTDAVAESVAITYEMYGINLRFDIRP